MTDLSNIDVSRLDAKARAKYEAMMAADREYRERMLAKSMIVEPIKSEVERASGNRAERRRAAALARRTAP